MKVFNKAPGPMEALSKRWFASLNQVLYLIHSRVLDPGLSDA